MERRSFHAYPVEIKWQFILNLSVHLRQRFHGSGSNWNRDIPGIVRPRVSTGLIGTVPFGTANRIQLGLLWNSVPNGIVLVETGRTVPNGSG